MQYTLTFIVGAYCIFDGFILIFPLKTTSLVMAIPNRYRRRNSYRLKGYDYAQPGTYFVTINCFQREPLFGHVLKKKMVLSPFGLIANTHWLETPHIRPNVELGEFIIMPDHIHGIIIIKERFSDEVQMDKFSFSEINSYGPEYSALISPSQTIGAIMRGYMGSVSSRINILRDTPGARVWQRNFYDRIVWDQQVTKSITRYIKNNPLKWNKNRND